MKKVIFSILAGKYYNEEGFEICGTPNKFGKPCMRIGKCPFHTGKVKRKFKFANNAVVISKTPPEKKKLHRKWTIIEHIRWLYGIHLYGRGLHKRIVGLFKGVNKSCQQINSHAQKYDQRQVQEVKLNESIHDITIEKMLTEEGRIGVAKRNHGLTLEMINKAFPPASIKTKMLINNDDDNNRAYIPPPLPPPPPFVQPTKQKVFVQQPSKQKVFFSNDYDLVPLFRNIVPETSPKNALFSSQSQQRKYDSEKHMVDSTTFQESRDTSDIWNINVDKVDAEPRYTSPITEIPYSPTIPKSTVSHDDTEAISSFPLPSVKIDENDKNCGLFFGQHGYDDLSDPSDLHLGILEGGEGCYNFREDDNFSYLGKRSREDCYLEFDDTNFSSLFPFLSDDDHVSKKRKLE